MVVFLDALVVVANGPRRHSVYVVAVVEAVVVEVVTHCSNEVGNDVHVGKFGKLRESTLSQHVEAHLHDIRAVQVIVVLNLLSVTFLNPVEESRELILFVEMDMRKHFRHRVDNVQS